MIIEMYKVSKHRGQVAVECFALNGNLLLKVQGASGRREEIMDELENVEKYCEMLSPERDS